MTVRRDKPPSLGNRQNMRPRSPSEALEPGRAPSRPRGGKVRGEDTRVSGFVRVLSGLFTLSLFGMGALAATGALLYHLYEKTGPARSLPHRRHSQRRRPHRDCRAA